MNLLAKSRLYAGPGCSAILGGVTPPSVTPPMFTSSKLTTCGRIGWVTALVALMVPVPPMQPVKEFPSAEIPAYVTVWGPALVLIVRVFGAAANAFADAAMTLMVV